MVSWSVQGPVLIRLIVHLVTFVSAMACMVMVFWMAMGNGPTKTVQQAEFNIAFWYGFLPFTICGVVLLPFILWDMMRITNRIAGPLYRFETILREFEETGVMPKAKLRDNDLMMDFCQHFNRFVDTMHERYPDCAPASSKSTVPTEVSVVRICAAEDSQPA